MKEQIAQQNKQLHHMPTLKESDIEDVAGSSSFGVGHRDIVTELLMLSKL